jgi:hypothetical protein
VGKRVSLSSRVAEECRARANAVHLIGARREIARSELPRRSNRREQSPRISLRRKSRSRHRRARGAPNLSPSRRTSST